MPVDPERLAIGRATGGSVPGEPIDILPSSLLLSLETDEPDFCRPAARRAAARVSGRALPVVFSACEVDVPPGDWPDSRPHAILPAATSARVAEFPDGFRSRSTIAASFALRRRRALVTK